MMSKKEMTYIQKPLPVKAVQWTGENIAEVIKFIRDNLPLLTNDFTVKYLEDRNNDFKSLNISFEPSPRIFKESWLRQLHLMIGHWIVIDPIGDWKIVSDRFFDEFYEKGEYSNDQN
jgi:hypothetical protein